MDIGIEGIVFPALSDRAARFVFPSEICAEDWILRSLGKGGARALESGRFLGWDRFKEKAARVDGRSPSDEALRRVFAASALEENAGAPFLSALIPPEFAAEWMPFAGYVAAKLPALGRLPEALRSAGAEPDPLAADWLALRTRYAAFLSAVGRFEPSYEPRSLASLPGRTFIFFPELIEDFGEYGAALASIPSVSIVRLPAGQPAARLSRPETALAEVRDALSEIGRLLERGVAASDIAVTVGDLPRYLPYLEREAALLSVPIAPRSGASLASTAGGRLFSALRAAWSSGFSYDSLRDLLASPAWPLKEPERARELLAAGRRLHAVAPWTEGGRRVDAWDASLPGALRSWYRGLRARVSDIGRAEGFAALRKAYNVFKSEFLVADREAWDEGSDLSLARCVEELGKLVEAESASALRPCREALGLFLRALRDKVYVRARREPGVALSAFRVSAGVMPEYHFVLGSSQEALSVPVRAFDFLGDGLGKRVGAALAGGARESEGDAGPDFIKAYALSGSRVAFSCPREGWDGESAVHGFLLSLAGGEEAAPSGEGRDDSYRREALWLSGRGPAPERLHRAQAESIAAAAEAGECPDAESLSLEAATAARAADSLRRELRDGSLDELRGVDATSIDAYLECPFRYLYLKLLGAESESSGIDFVDALFLGDVYHEALSRLFERVKAEDGRFRPERREEYRRMIGDCLRQAFERLASRRGPFVRIILEAYRARLQGYLELVVDAEAETFPNLEVLNTERELEERLPGLAGGFVLRGRIDRISRSDEGAVIVDYKKGGVPPKAAVAPDGDGRISAAQIPCYLRLASAAGEEPDSAWYFSIEGDGRGRPARPVRAFGDAGPDGRGAYVPREELASFLEAFDAALRHVAGGIAGGSYPLAPKDRQKDVCGGCGARGICRERYALRFRSPSGRVARPAS